MHRRLDLGLHDAHLSHYAVHCHVLVDKVRFEASRCHVVFAEVALEVHVVHGHLLRELCVLRHLLHFAAVLREAFDRLTQLVLEHLDALQRFVQHIVSQSWVVLSQIVNVHTQPCLPPYHRLYPLLTLRVVQVVLYHLLQLQFVRICCHHAC